jgi:hypothetical protein
VVVIVQAAAAQPKFKNQKKGRKENPLPKNPVVQLLKNPLHQSPQAAKNPAGRKRRSDILRPQALHD